MNKIIEIKQKETWNKILLKSGIAGATVSLISLPFQHPFDALKTNMQSKQTKMIETIKTVLQIKGWRGFYNGFSLNATRVALKQSCRWPLNISVSQLYKTFLPNTNQILRQIITGFTISFSELALLCPFERVKIWVMTTKTQSQTRIRQYYEISFKIKDLYRGFTPTLIRQGLSWTSFLASLEIFKNLMKQYRGSQYLSTMDIYLIGIPVSLINTLCIMPIDCIKTFYQKYEGFSSNQPFFQVMKKIFKSCGWYGLYSGFGPRIIQSFINSAFTLHVLQNFHVKYKKTR